MTTPEPTYTLTPALRIYAGDDGRYIHADDLAAFFRDGVAIADPVMAVCLPRIVRAIELIRDGQASPRLSPEEADAIDRLENPDRWEQP